MPSETFQQESYHKHTNWYNQKFPTEEKKLEVLNSFLNYEGSINHWLQHLFFSCLIPLTIDKSQKWMTIGDAYGHDANFLLKNGITDVLATDLSTDLLQVSQEIGLIQKCRAENAEALSLADNSIDYILCKESYHHFPRPYAALYEMIRVSRKAIIIMEPQDPISKMSSLLFFHNLLEKLSPGLINKIWKNRFSYEEVGNYVYKVSEREFEKFTAALNLPCLAVKQFNPNFWFPGSEILPSNKSNKQFKSILHKKSKKDFLTKLGIIPGQTLSIIVFKEPPTQQVKKSLKENGYKMIEIPKNPYL